MLGTPTYDEEIQHGSEDDGDDGSRGMSVADEEVEDAGPITRQEAASFWDHKIRHRLPDLEDDKWEEKCPNVAQLVADVPRPSRLTHEQMGRFTRMGRVVNTALQRLDHSARAWEGSLRALASLVPDDILTANQEFIDEIGASRDFALGTHNACRTWIQLTLADTRVPQQAIFDAPAGPAAWDQQVLQLITEFAPQRHGPKGHGGSKRTRSHRRFNRRVRPNVDSAPQPQRSTPTRNFQPQAIRSSPQQRPDRRQRKQTRP